MYNLLITSNDTAWDHQSGNDVFPTERLLRAAIIEVKLSDEKDYLKQGYEQALLYSSEYAYALSGWPKVVLVVSAQDIIQGVPRREDDVVATSWNDWVHDAILDGFIAGSGFSRGCRLANASS